MGIRDRKTWRRGLLVLAGIGVGACGPSSGLPRNSSKPETREMEQGTSVHHAIDYIEFVVTDMTESQRFYHEAFGWEFNDYGPDYAGIRTGHREAGGLRLDTQPSRGGPLVILYSEDLEMTLARVRDAGGRVVKDPFAFPGGRRFHFLDPSGNELAVWSDR